ncbi:glycosyltransferase family 8 protein [Mucilaginibacter sp. PAMB04274]|uniref:glycosyltransferase family 8 protein n=1 Tax=Mucilaginibacter sp. PAMB04274 TaxID=3138568 RepID=UPI0031F5FE38
MPSLNIAFCINRLALVGLGSTVSSLIRNCSDPSKITFWFMCAGLTETDKNNIKLLLNAENFKGSYHLVDFDPVSQFKMLTPLHGDWTPYGRLLLADLLPVDVVMYLDADLLIEVDVLELLDADLGNYGLAAVPGAKLKHALDNPFLNGKLNISLEADYFNSGVLLMNLVHWRSENTKQKLLNIAERYPNDLISHDQTLLNAVFAQNYYHLPAAYNCAWYAYRNRPKIADRMILHFLGSPKPWDIGGRFLHKAYLAWKSYLNKDWAKYYFKTSLNDVKRAWNIRRSYGKVVRKMMGK